MKYQPNRGGHAPGHLREAFLEYLDDTDEPWGRTVFLNDEEKPIDWLIGQLWNCTDILPSMYYDALELTGQHTYSAAARLVSAKLAEERSAH